MNSNRYRRLFRLGRMIFVLALVMGFAGAVSAASQGSLSATGPLTVAVSFLPNTDDGGGLDYVYLIWFNSSGTAVDIDGTGYPYNATTIYNTSLQCHDIFSGTCTQPVYAELRDAPMAVDVNNPATVAQLQGYPLLATTYITPDTPFSGPPIPEGWVLSGITCDTAVFDVPGGSPVGIDAVYAGQTFYANPTPETAPDGSSWTQIFVSSFTHPYIPSACVN